MTETSSHRAFLKEILFLQAWRATSIFIAASRSVGEQG
jgi:hypothetical protein